MGFYYLSNVEIKLFALFRFRQIPPFFEKYFDIYNEFD